MSDTFDHEGDAYDDMMRRSEGSGYLEDYEPGYRGFTPREAPTCNRCGKAGLNWQHDGDRWVLHEGRHRVHKCPTTNPADDFEVLE